MTAGTGDDNVPGAFTASAEGRGSGITQSSAATNRRRALHLRRMLSVPFFVRAAATARSVPTTGVAIGLVVVALAATAETAGIPLLSSTPSTVHLVVLVATPAPFGAAESGMMCLGARLLSLAGALRGTLALALLTGCGSSLAAGATPGSRGLPATLPAAASAVLLLTGFVAGSGLGIDP